MAGGPGCRIPYSPSPPTPPPRFCGAFHLLPRELLQHHSGVEQRRELTQKWDPMRTPLMLGVERGEVDRAVGQLATESTAGLGKGVPTCLRSSGPAFSLGNRDPQS